VTVWLAVAETAIARMDLRVQVPAPVTKGVWLRGIAKVAIDRRRRSFNRARRRGSAPARASRSVVVGAHRRWKRRRWRPY
jgi:hypothetical protein